MQIYTKWPPEAISQQVAQGGPANLQIYARSGFRKPFPSRWPREVPPTYKSIREVASGGHFPAGGPGRSRQRANLREVASGGHFPAGGPGRSRQRTNLYEKWPLEAMSQQVAQGGPANVQIYERSGLRRPSPSRRPREQAAQGDPVAGLWRRSMVPVCGAGPWRWSVALVRGTGPEQSLAYDSMA